MDFREVHQQSLTEMEELRKFQSSRTLKTVRSRNSHVTSRPMSFPTHPIPEGDVEAFHSYRRAAERAAMHLGYTMVYRETFLQIQLRPLQHTCPQELNQWEFVNRGAAPFLHSGERVRDTQDQYPRCQSGPSAKD